MNLSAFFSSPPRHKSFSTPRRLAGWQLFLTAIVMTTGLSARAGQTTQETPASDGTGRPDFAKVRQEVSVLFYGAAPGDVEAGEGLGGEMSQMSGIARYVANIPLSRELFVRVGPAWQGFWFDYSGGGDLLPEELHETVLEVGLGWRPGGNLSYLAWVSPGLYSDFEDLSFDDVAATGVAAALWKPSEDFELQFGVRFSTVGEYPVLPIAGIRWRFADRWELNLTAPQPEIIWLASDTLKLSLGGSIRGGSFRLAEDFGTQRGRPDLDNEWIGFREFRTFAASEFTFRKTLRLRTEAGLLIGREFEFIEDEEEIEIDNSFYASVGLRYSF